MPYLKKLTKNGNDYYYLFHTVRNNGRYDKPCKYVGKKRPDKETLEKMKKEFLEEIKSNNGKAKKKANLISALQDIQDKHGYLPMSELKTFSKKNNIPGTDIFGVVSFYSQFRLEKPAKYTISVCTGTACHVKGSENILSFLEQQIGIKRNNTTENGLIRLETVNCIGACAKAPAIMINERIYGKVTKDKLKELLAGLK